MLLANENVLSAILCVFACVSSTEAYFQKLGRWKPSLQGKNCLLVLVFIVVNRFAGWQRFKQRMSGMFVILAYDTVCFVRHPGGVVWVQSSIETKRSDTFAPRCRSFLSAAVLMVPLYSCVSSSTVSVKVWPVSEEEEPLLCPLISTGRC